MNSGQFMEGYDMSIEICKYRSYFNRTLVMNKVVCSRRYQEYLESAMIELRTYYFRVNGEIRKNNLETVMKELDLLIEWVENHTEGKALEYLKSQLQYMQKLIPENLQEDDDILHIL